MCMGYQIREIREDDYTILADFLYEANFILEGMEKPSKFIIEKPGCKYILLILGKMIIGVWLQK